MDKTLLLATFIFPERLDWFTGYLNTKFSIPKDRVFGYKNLDDESKLIITFKITIPEGERLNLKELFPSAVIIHKRGDALYTINALNLLIEKKLGDSIGNIDYKSYKVNWDEYQNQFIIIDSQELVFLNIKRVF